MTSEKAPVIVFFFFFFWYKSMIFVDSLRVTRGLLSHSVFPNNLCCCFFFFFFFFLQVYLTQPLYIKPTLNVCTIEDNYICNRKQCITFNKQWLLLFSVSQDISYLRFTINPYLCRSDFSGKTLTQNAQKIFDVQQQVTKATTTNPLRVYVSY